eukprot:g15075.t1
MMGGLNGVGDLTEEKEIGAKLITSDQSPRYLDLSSFERALGPQSSGCGKNSRAGATKIMSEVKYFKAGHPTSVELQEPQNKKKHTTN